MTREEFILSFKQGCIRSERVLNKKANEYARPNQDRLEQFHKAALSTNTTPEHALLGMAVKHWTSVCDMSLHPTDYTLKEWRAKTTDLRNYIHLLDALLEEKLR